MTEGSNGWARRKAASLTDLDNAGVDCRQGHGYSKSLADSLVDFDRREQGEGFVFRFATSVLRDLAR
jgi:hypothetical protein